MIKKKEKKEPEMNLFGKIDTLMKLRIAVISIFALSTLSIVLVFVDAWLASGILIILSYILVIILMIKLLLTKKL